MSIRARLVMASGLLLAACSPELQMDFINACDAPIEFYIWEQVPDGNAFDLESPPSVTRIAANDRGGVTGVGDTEQIDLHGLRGTLALSSTVEQGVDHVEIVIAGEACATLFSDAGG